MKALLLVAHGSRRNESNDEISRLRDQLKKIGASEYDIVDNAFLESAVPGITDRIDALIIKGVKEIVLFPYFLAAGQHVVKDIPEIIEKVRGKHPDLHIRITKHLGASEEIADLIIKQAHH